ncbi:malto-oligosyltrehalose synthase [Microvirga rosea]|uniref:malto-oligosyltrehalose synthase n=1 Tax=Microvirga rosea TaxID=2715425 RepID=UPI001D0B8CA6|nr:malto-oligosyltrehalose synthase [Microvirga rosea]MCB8822192.1 malto-oligosyltrehalose synthase [Microvirga rosea]
MSTLDALTERMAALIGIAPRYTDAFGQSVDTNHETRVALLEGLGLSVRTEREARDSLATLEILKAGPLPSLIPVQADKPATIHLRKATPATTWRLTSETGHIHEGRLAGSSATSIDIPALPAGYHRLVLGDAKATVIAAPARCWTPDALNGDNRLWGVAAQIYSLRSERDLGIGDFSTVADAAEAVGASGGAFLGLSPVHALFAADRTKISPYSPSSRLFLEPLYIDPTRVEGSYESGASELLDETKIQERLVRLRSAQLIDYAEVWGIKRQLLDLLWKHFQAHADQSAFLRFRQEGNAALEAHATFEALSEHFRNQDLWWVGDWPDAYRTAETEEVRAFRETHHEQVSFHAWLQWLADLQLGAAAERARACGMPIGLYRDLAVGADRGGSEIWSDAVHFSPSLSVGAPPDPLGPQGQDWGLPPLNPLALEQHGISAFRNLVRANMRHAGAIRIDHAFQLQRLFLIPSGAPASQGAYVDYPFEALLAVLRIESHRACCLVIAEDLGTAPEGFSDAIMRSGLLSYRVLPFERNGAAFKTPRDYPSSALAVLTTHDLPTFTGWWKGLDIDLRQTFGVFDPKRAEEERTARAADRQSFTEALSSEGILAGRKTPAFPPLQGAARYLARTKSVLTALQIEDVANELNQPNMPGMDAGHPNWRRRLSSTINDMTAPGSTFAKLAVIMTEEGRVRRPGGTVLASPPPRATYRLQLHKGFTFDDGAKIAPYLAKLGVSHVYSSPIQAAAAGSSHGYDIVDHSTINPELGGEQGFRRFSDALRAHGLGLVLDIVPNHMGVGGKDNPWWLSVLEWGRLSPVADAFDIDWERPGANGKLIVPFLGDLYGKSLEEGNLKLAFDPDEGSFSVWHWDHRFPICPSSYPLVLDDAVAALSDRSKAADLIRLTDALRGMSKAQRAEGPRSLPDLGQTLKNELGRIVANRPDIENAIDQAVRAFNGIPGQTESFSRLHRLLEAQPYRLSYWRVASSEINYRRFFDINSLAGIRVENPEIFERTHDLIIRLVEEGIVDGLRIDHIDGLADPEGYTRALQDRVGPGFYIVVEKILEPGEELRPWPVAGTTGYDILNLIDGVLLDHRSGAALERTYRDASGFQAEYDTLLRQAKTDITERSFASELEALVSDLKRVAEADYHTRDFTPFAIRRALVDLIAAFPVYRSYLSETAASSEDAELIEGVLESVKSSSPQADGSVYDFIAATLLGRSEKADPADVRRFRRRFQQLTGPVMAKSLEDTLFYRYGRLIALNEVGGDPRHFGLTPEAFHQANADRADAWPHTMVATATHDTKRGEDARARLLALSEIPEQWAEALKAWHEVVSPHLSSRDGIAAPDANDQVILLQALLGAWPLDLLDNADAKALAAFHERMKAYLTKALREAKRQTSWTNPNEAYETATLDLLQALLEPGSGFIERFQPFLQRLSLLGMLNGLSRTVLKATLPGVPDIYQGTEFWDFSLVDPDNRRPVDYAARAHALDDGASLETCLTQWQSGHVKQRILASLLEDRLKHPSLYAKGDYAPLEVRGQHADRVLAFSRQHGSAGIVVIVPRLWAGLIGASGWPLKPSIWSDTSVEIPPGEWVDLLTGNSVTIARTTSLVGDLMPSIPFVVLRRS